MDLVCFSHLRWDFVYQRPQHLMSRFARAGYRVFYVEEPVSDSSIEYVELNERAGVCVVKLHVPPGLDDRAIEILERRLLDQLVEQQRLGDYLLWYYSPMQLGVSRHLLPGAQSIVYDCMDDLASFQGAPPGLRAREDELFGWADIVFTGGLSLFEAKRERHSNIHAFPSSVDMAHFCQARHALPEPADQRLIAEPRIGFFGVVDERMDLQLLDDLAALRPEWQLVIVGEVVKIDPGRLPQRPNLHYLGLKRYGDLPAYLAGWTVAILPFARNRATRFISPTKIPEYLAGGKPVVSTSIADVVRTYAPGGLVRVADTAPNFVAQVELAFREDRFWLRAVDEFLAHTSWDATWQSMHELVRAAVQDSPSATGLSAVSALR